MDCSGRSAFQLRDIRGSALHSQTEFIALSQASCSNQACNYTVGESDSMIRHSATVPQLH